MGGMDMATGLSETAETSQKPILKQAGATHWPQHLIPETLGGKTTPLRGGGFPRFGGAEALRRFRGFNERKESDHD